MFQSCVRLGLLLTLCAVVPVAIIRARPYDDGGLRVGLVPAADCPAPCFMGVRPGVTTLEEFVTIMARHEWVAERFRSDYTTLANHVDERGNTLTPIFRWEWETTRPAWIDDQRAGVVWIPANQVTVMLVETDIVLGDFLLAFGEPDRVTLTSVKDEPVIGINGYEYEYTAWYTKYQMIVTTGGVCKNSRLYDWPVRLFFQDVPQHSGEAARLDVCR